MTPTDATRPADGPAPVPGHTETHDAREGLGGLLGERYGAFATALLHSAERLAEVTAERDALAASVARVRALHAGEFVEEDDDEGWNRCYECGDNYPCSTLAALDGSES